MLRNSEIMPYGILFSIAMLGPLIMMIPDAYRNQYQPEDCIDFVSYDPFLVVICRIYLLRSLRDYLKL